MKWIPLSAFAALFGGLAWFCSDSGWLIVAGIFATVAIVLVLTALAEYVEHYWDNASIIYERFMRARNSSPVVAISEAIGRLHPDAARLLNRFTARAVWDVKLDMDKRERDVMIRGTNIHLGFVEFVLDNSVNGQLYPRWKFAEGSYEWDAYKQVADRAQHDEFELWLSTRLIVARAYDRAPAVFLPPWTPELVKEVMGIADKIEFYSPPLKGGVKSIPDEKKTASGNPATAKKEPEIPLSDEDLEKIRALESARSQLSVKDYMKTIGKTIQ